MGNVFVLSSKPELYRLTDNRTMHITRTATVMLLDVRWRNTRGSRWRDKLSDFWEITDMVTYFPVPGKEMYHFLRRLEITSWKACRVAGNEGRRRVADLSRSVQIIRFASVGVGSLFHADSIWGGYFLAGHCFLLPVLAALRCRLLSPLV